MSRRRFRFFTNPRIFSFFAEPRLNLVQLFLILLVSLPSFSFTMFLLNRTTEQKAREYLLQKLAVARSEIQQLKAAAPRTTSASLKVSSETENQTPGVHMHDHGDVFRGPEDSVKVMQSGILKGLPMDVAKGIQEEYRVASMARATRYHEWDMRRRDHHKRDMALVDEELAHGAALISSSNEGSERTLTVLASYPPEHLEVVRTELLKTQSAENIEPIFRRISEIRATKSPEQLLETALSHQQNKETQAIEMQAWQLKFEQLNREREQLNREREQLMRTKPPSPNIDFNEFYTEWKERNNTKSSP